MRKTRSAARSAGGARRRRGRPTHSDDGVDLTLIRWMLSLTPAERLEVLEDNMNSLMRLRDGTAER